MVSVRRSALPITPLVDKRTAARSRRLITGMLASLVAAVAGGAVAFTGQSADESWRQWGGSGRDFMVRSGTLVESWPPQGPSRLWHRPLGEGHSTILFENGRLYTMYRLRGTDLPDGEWGSEEAVVALDAASGTTLWEHHYTGEVLNFRFGAGPHSTPLIVGERLFAAGTNKQLFALDKATGALLWSHDLVREYGAPPTLIRPAVTAGYAPSPLAWGDTVIVPAGGDGQAVMAFEQSDGTLVWKSGDFLIAPSSPILIDVTGQTQLVVVGGQTINGLDPDTGTILWSHANETGGDMNITTAVWGSDNLLFVSSAYDGGSRVVRLTRDSEGTEIEELWFSRRLRVHIGTTIRLGDFIVGSSGDFGPTFITAMDIGTGEQLWRRRGFPRTTFLYADNKLILLDEEGNLSLARASREGLEVLTRAQLLEPIAWSPPTLVGTTLYVRDRRSIMALELGT